MMRAKRLRSIESRLILVSLLICNGAHDESQGLSRRRRRKPANAAPSESGLCLYTYAVYRRDGTQLLFDNRKDPYQVKDLAGERAHRSTLEHFKARLDKWRKEHNDAFEACTWYESRWTNNRNIVNTATGVTQDLKALERYTRLPD